MIYFLSKLFTAIFLPPGLFITVLAASALYAKRYRRWLGGAALLLYLLSIHPVTDRLLAHYEEPWRHTALPRKADAVVTLGGSCIRGNPIPLMDESLKRHLYGLAIAKRMNVPLIVTGAGDNAGYDEFQGLMDSLKALKPLLFSDIEVSHTYVDRFVVIPETESVDTYENAIFSVRIVGKKDADLIVVTSAYHMTRALRLFRLAGVENVHPAAVNFYVLSRAYTWRDYLPSMWTLLNSYSAMHEFFGLMKVRMREWKRG